MGPRANPGTFPSKELRHSSILFPFTLRLCAKPSIGSQKRLTPCLPTAPNPAPPPPECEEQDSSKKACANRPVPIRLTAQTKKNDVFRGGRRIFSAPKNSCGRWMKFPLPKENIIRQVAVRTQNEIKDTFEKETSENAGVSKPSKPTNQQISKN